MSPGAGNILAVIFDFDDTLTPDSTTKLLVDGGIDPDKFWRGEVDPLIADGYDLTLAWLNRFLENVGPDRPLGPLTNAGLREFGAQLDDSFASGIPELFDALKAEVAKHRDISIEFYIISGGLEEVIRGSSIVQQHFADVWGCQLGEDPDTGQLTRIKRCINFTEKTRYLFEINKGLRSSDTHGNPYLVNKAVPEADRRIPFENMIYVGDGLTDIPCFSLIKRMGGVSFGVFHPSKAKSAMKAYEELLKAGRVASSNEPAFGEHDALGALLRAAVTERCTRIVLAGQQALGP